MRILVFNAGSSSLKFELRDVPADGAGSGVVSGSFTDFEASGSRFSWSAGARSDTERLAAGDLVQATHALLDRLADASVFGSDLLADVEAVAHRVVHGGERFRAPVILDGPALTALAALSPLAPLHNPPALAVAAAVRARLGERLPAVAVFDTAWFATLPPAATRYAVPREWQSRFGIRRYGFHGIAHRDLVDRARARLGHRTCARIISLQLGRGCSIAASRDGRPVATSMGFTPLEGLVMGTRCGDIDPGAVLHVMERGGMSPAAMARELNERSGLLGLSAGGSADVRELLDLAAAGDADAALAIEVFCGRARHYVGAYLAELGGADAIVFGGGIGENQPAIRQRILEGLGFAGVLLDCEANTAARGAEAAVHAAASAASVYVIPVQEAAVIAAEAAACLRASRPVRTSGS